MVSQKAPEQQEETSFRRGSGSLGTVVTRVGYMPISDKIHGEKIQPKACIVANSAKSPDRRSSLAGAALRHLPTRAAPARRAKVHSLFLSVRLQATSVCKSFKQQLYGEIAAEAIEKMGEAKTKRVKQLQQWANATTPSLYEKEKTLPKTCDRILDTQLKHLQQQTVDTMRYCHTQSIIIDILQQLVRKKGTAQRKKGQHNV